MHVIGGRIPEVHQHQLKVSSYDAKSITIIDANPKSRSNFNMTIELDKDAPEPHHCLEDSERDVVFVASYRDGKEMKTIQGEAHLKCNGTIRCDSLDDLAFWMEIDKRT